MRGKAMRVRGLLLSGLLVVGLGVTGWASAAFIPPDGRIDFDVVRNSDSPLGHHRLRFTREGGQVVMEKEIRFQVKLAFITAFRYEHENREVWEEGRLVSLDTRTHDDGKEHWVRGRATPDGFAVDSSRGSLLAPADVVTTSYWNIGLIRATRLLDTQRGVLMDVRVEPLGVEPIQAGGQVVEARHFRIHILTNTPGATDTIDIWYDDNDQWVKLAFDAKDQAITYRLAPPAGGHTGEGGGIPTQQAERPAAGE